MIQNPFKLQFRIENWKNDDVMQNYIVSLDGEQSITQMDVMDQNYVMFKIIVEMIEIWWIPIVWHY